MSYYPQNGGYGANAYGGAPMQDFRLAGINLGDYDNAQKIKKTLLGIALVLIGVAVLALVFVIVVYSIYGLPPVETIFAPGNPPGALVDNTQDFSRYYFAMSVFFGMALFFGAGIAAAGRPNLVWICIAIAITSFFMFLVLAGFGLIFYGLNANKQGTSNNVADSDVKCCDPEFYNNPANNCPNSFTYTYNATANTYTQDFTPQKCIAPYDAVTTSDLKWNQRFTYKFAADITLCALSALIGILAYASLIDTRKLIDAINAASGLIRGADHDEDVVPLLYFEKGCGDSDAEELADVVSE